MNKILTVSIAGYNVEKYINKTLDSILIEDIEDLEVLVEDDGGTDNTANIVREYEKKYPGIVKLIHKENGGYGSTINKSIEIAQGKYFKQLDGDDWYDSENFKSFLELLRGIDTDVVYTPYKTFFEKNNTYIERNFFEEKYYGEYNIDDVINNCSHSLEMYTMTYKTKILRDNNINLLTKCLYTDKEYAMYPIIYCKNIYIEKEHIYIYRFGRTDQSMSIESKRKHYNEQLKVTKRAIQTAKENISNMTEEKKKYIFNYLTLEACASISAFLIILPPNKENLEKIKNFEEEIKNTNVDVYEKMEKQSKIIRIIRKSKYNYIIYKILSIIKIFKLKNLQK